jgi:hypothetical protein
MKLVSLRKIRLAAVVLTVLTTGIIRADDSTKPIHKEAEAVVTIKMKELLEAPLVKKYALDLIKKGLEGDKETKDMLMAAGIDPMKDLTKLTIGISGDNPGDMKVTAALEGKFDAAKINEAVKKEAESKKEKLVTSEVGGKTIFEMPSKGPGPTGYMSVVSNKLIVIGTSKDYVSDAITGKSSGVKKELAELVAKTDPKSLVSIVYDIASKKEQLSGMIQEEALKKLVAKVQSVSIDLKSDKDVDLSISILSGDIANAKGLLEVLSPYMDQAKALAPLAVGSQPVLKPLLKTVNSLKADQKDKAVILSLTLTEETINEMVPKK